MALSTKPPRAARFHRIPPAPGWRADFEVLHEVEGVRSLLGFALWELLRDTSLWARAVEGARADLFHPRHPDFGEYAVEAFTLHAPELTDAWATLEALRHSPAHAARDALADACRAVYAWAEERAFMQTAAHFAEAAALVRPDAPELANLAARTCRRAALPERSGPWYQRGRALAIRAHSFPDRFSATVGYGWLMYSFGRYDRARRIMNSTVRQAVNRGFKRMAGEAEHALLAICSEERIFAAGERHALNALTHYPRHHKRLPLLVHDVGYFYVATGIYTAGLSILTEAVKVFARPQEAMMVWSSIARAAAGARRAGTYANARDSAMALEPLYPEYAPATLRNVAYAAQLAQDWDMAEHAAHKAASMARQRHMADVERTALDLLGRVRARAPGAPEVAPPANSRADEVARLCRVRIQQWTGPKRGRPPGETPPV